MRRFAAHTKWAIEQSMARSVARVSALSLKRRRPHLWMGRRAIKAVLMFASRRRSIVFPQAEHARFSGALALAWAERPPLPFAAFVRGVADHDRGYGERDCDPIGGVMGSERWVEIQRRGFTPRGEDAVVDLVVALHVRR